MTDEEKSAFDKRGREANTEKCNSFRNLLSRTTAAHFIPFGGADSLGPWACYDSDGCYLASIFSRYPGMVPVSQTNGVFKWRDLVSDLGRDMWVGVQKLPLEPVKEAGDESDCIHSKEVSDSVEDGIEQAARGQTAQVPDLASSRQLVYEIDACPYNACRACSGLETVEGIRGPMQDKQCWWLECADCGQVLVCDDLQTLLDSWNYRNPTNAQVDDGVCWRELKRRLALSKERNAAAIATTCREIETDVRKRVVKGVWAVKP